MSAIPARAAAVWISLVLAALLGVTLYLQRPEPAVAVVIPPVERTQPVIDASSTITTDMAAILASELLLGPAALPAYLPLITR